MIALIQTQLQAIGVIVGILALVWAVTAWWLGPRSCKPFVVFLKDNAGIPRSDVVLVGCHGDKCLPDASGMVTVPGSWNKSTISIREHFTWAEIMTVMLVKPQSGTATVTVPQ
ncbi:MAG TPA: hypothetical protein VK581_09895 [Chthoniobacterales bacterium]|nr:hypothetical protein [Chthoniobacterales bacterium]